MIEGMIQDVEYGSSASLLFWLCKKDGRVVKPDAAPTMVVYDSAGNSIVSSASMTAVPVGAVAGRGFLAYDAQSTAFTPGAILTGETSNARALIEKDVDSGSTGILTLSQIFGTFADDKAITDSSSGAAVANGTAYSCEYYYSLNASSTSVFARGENYCMKVSYLISELTYHDWVYFDVVSHPFGEPIVTSDRIDIDCPDWKKFHPDGMNAIWDEQIKAAHAELARRIRALGNRPAFVAKREQLFPYELAIAKSIIAENLIRFPIEERKYWRQKAEDLWSTRGGFAYDSYQETTEIDENENVMSSTFVR